MGVCIQGDQLELFYKYIKYKKRRVCLRFFNEGGEFEYNLMYSYEKFLQYIVYSETVKKSCPKCIRFVNDFLTFT